MLHGYSEPLDEWKTITFGNGAENAYGMAIVRWAGPQPRNGLSHASLYGIRRRLMEMSTANKIYELDQLAPESHRRVRAPPPHRWFSEPDRMLLPHTFPILFPYIYYYGAGPP